MVHLDYHPTNQDLQIRYSYPFSGEHQLLEQVIAFDCHAIPTELKEKLDWFSRAMAARIPRPVHVRLPHAIVTPDVFLGYLTFVVLDQKRAAVVPLARLYYYEEVKLPPELLVERVERKVYVERRGFTKDERRVATQIRKFVRKLAWEAYRALMGTHLKKEQRRALNNQLERTLGTLARLYAKNIVATIRLRRRIRRLLAGATPRPSDSSVAVQAGNRSLDA